MIRVEHSVQISRSPEDVFVRLSDVERLPEWQTSALEVHADGPIAQGSRIFEKRRLMGREMDNELEVVAFDPPRRLTLRSLGGPVKLTIVASGKPGGVMKLAGPMIERTAREEIRGDFARLKELLET